MLIHSPGSDAQHGPRRRYSSPDNVNIVVMMMEGEARPIGTVGIMVPDAKSEDPLRVAVNRPAQDLEDFESSHERLDEERTGSRQSVMSCLKYECSKERLQKGLKARFPFIDWIRNYDVKQSIVGDMVAGITVGVMQIPLGMAYSMLAGLPAVNGLYVSFFAVLLYGFLGTSKHISQGTFAVVCLMFANTVIQISGGTASSTGTGSSVNDSIGNDTWFSTTEEAFSTTGAPGARFTATEVAAAIALLVGIFQVIMGFLRIGNLNIYLSDILLSGFTTGCGVLVFTSQVDGLLGIKFPRFAAPFEIVKKYVYLFEHMHETNVATVIMSVICIVILALFAEVINPWIIKRIPVPVPTELIVVVVGTALSKGCDLPGKYGISIVGAVASGLPQPFVPPVVPLFMDIVGDCFAVAVISFVISYSIARIFSKRFNYDLNANQEFIAMGTSNVFASFFSGFPMCVAMSRTMVQVEVGVKTQLAGIVSSLVVLLVVVAIAPLFEYLPNCVLASIIVVGIRRIFLQLRDVKRAWSISKLEALTWLITFLVVCLFTIGIGFLAGVLFAILSVVLTSQMPQVSILGLVPETGIYKDLKKYPKALQEPGIKIYQFSAPLLFANCKTFRKEMYSLTGINPKLIYKKQMKLKRKEEKAAKKRAAKENSQQKDLNASASNSSLEVLRISMHDGAGTANPAFEIEKRNERNRGEMQMGKDDSDYDSSCDASDDRSNQMSRDSVHHIVVDLSFVSFVDSSGVSTLLQVITEYKRIDIDVSIAGCSDPVIEMMKLSNFAASVSKDCLYPAVADAVAYAVYEHAITQRDGRDSASGAAAKY